MGVYRSDQAQLTFAAETTQGADSEMMIGTVSTGSTELASAASIGDRTITVDSNSNFTVGDMIRIGEVAGASSGSDATTVHEYEVRRLEAINSTVFTLDRPLAYAHAVDHDVKELSASSEEDINKHITFIPGIYDTIDTPDPEMSIEGRRFLSTQSKRNWSVAYSGQHTLNGSVAGIVLLNGWCLRFPIGKITTEAQNVTGAVAINMTAADGAKKGDVYITCDGADVADIVAGTKICIWDHATNTLNSTKTAEVRVVVLEPTTNTFKLNYPLHFDHIDDAKVSRITSDDYIHEIVETVDLDTVTWHVHMKDSTETAAKNFDRRYVGGMIGSSTISAEEGGMVTMSWDSVNFLNMLHNQANQTTVGTASGDLYNGASPEANMPRFGLMQNIDTDDVGRPYHNGSAINNGTGYPTTQPYYFSEGTIKFFDQEFARIRSFALSIANNEEPRYYIGKQGSRARGPYEIKEGPREYSMSASVALPDVNKNAAATVAGSGDNLASLDNATELFKQLLLEGDYGAGGAALHKRGFNATLKFERGTNDYIIIDIPGSSTAGTPNTPTNQLNSQGIFINSAPHNITGDNPFQVDLDMFFPSLRIVIRDTEPVYP